MNPYLSPFANHLWQSTLFAGVAGLLTLALRKNRARVRHAVWLAASCKFLVPVSLLIAVGGHFQWRTEPQSASANWSVVMNEFSQPFATRPPASPVATPHGASPLAAVLLGTWACGFLGIACSWWIRWRRIRAAVRAGSPVQVELPIKAISSPTLLEPAVFGIFRPVLVLPKGILEHLTPAQLQAVIAHELCHLRHRDNLVATLQMFVETVCWFHPLVWWIGRRMVEERERACDEEVLRLGSEPRVYAEGILNVCKLCVESPLACVSGVTGADLKRRIEAIVTNRATCEMSVSRKLLLVAASLVAIAGPVVIGLLGALPSPGQTQTEAATFEVASVKPNQAGGVTTRRIEPGTITYLNITLGEFIAMAYGVKHYQLSGPDWIINYGSTDRYDIVAKAAGPVASEQLQRMLGPLLADRFHLAFHRETRELPVFALVVAKDGPKFKPGDGGETSMRPDGTGGFFYKNYSMGTLAAALSLMTAVGRPVLDRTGLPGGYTFNANLYDIPKGMDRVDIKKAMVENDAIFSTLPAQLGLKLESQRAPIELLVIDRADKLPTEN
jgi:bla regulator protein BlaR1